MSKEILDEIIKSQKTEHNVFLLWGEEDFLRLHYKNNLISLLKPSVMPELNLYNFDGKDYSTTAVDEAIESLPVMDTQKLLVFDNSLIFLPSGRGGTKAEFLQYWENRLKDIPPYVYIIFNESQIDKRSALFKQISKNYLSAEFSYLDEAKMIKWIISLFKKNGKSISQANSAYLYSLCPEGMMTIKNETLKLCAYADKRDEITKDDIDLLITPKLDDRVFDMVGAMLSGDSQTAISLLYDLFALKTEPAQILGAIIYNLEKIACVKGLAESGNIAPQIAGTLKLAPFMVNKFLALAKKFSADKLDNLIKGAKETDLGLKTNSMDNNVLLELYIIKGMQK